MIKVVFMSGSQTTTKILKYDEFVVQLNKQIRTGLI